MTFANGPKIAWVTGVFYHPTYDGAIKTEFGTTGDGAHLVVHVGHAPSLVDYVFFL